MARHRLNRIIRKATGAEVRRHKQIREQTDKEFAARRKPVSPTRVFEVARSRIRQNSGRCGGRRPARDRPNSWEFGYFRSKCATSKTRVILAKLRSKRELMGFSLAELAKRTGMTRSNLCQLEQNGHNAKLETLARYAAALGCELVINLQASASQEAD